MQAASASSAPTPARLLGSSSPRWGRRRSRRSACSSLPRRASPILSTCWGRPRLRSTRRRCRSCSVIPPSMRSSSSSCRRRPSRQGTSRPRLGAPRRAARSRSPVSSSPRRALPDRSRIRSPRRARSRGAPSEVRGLLAAYGLPLVAERVAATVADAVAAARELGYPVAVKTAAPGVHKTERGGVALNLADDDALLAAAERIGAPLVVQTMASGDAELLVGVVQDPVFGPLVGFGPGGVLAELIGEAAFRIAPLADVDAEELIMGGKAGRLVHGFRGKPPLDADALTAVLHRLSRLAVELPAVAELDVNPLIARADGCMVVDARVRVRRHERPVRVKTW